MKGDFMYKCAKCGEPTNILYNGICEICYDEELELETE